MTTENPRNRPLLTRDRVLRAGVSYADERGLKSLSMRGLAKELGFGVMSLYHYVAEKDDLLEGMIDHLAQEIEIPPADAEWKSSLRECAISAHHMLLRHRWASSLWGTTGPGPAKLRYLDSILRVLRESGFSEEMACGGFHALTMHVDGFTLQLLDLPFNNRTELVGVAKKFLSQLPQDEYPYFAEHVKHHLNQRSDRDDFVFMLDLILDGLERDQLAIQPEGTHGDH